MELRSKKAKLDGEMCGDWDDLGAPLMSTPTALDVSTGFSVYLCLSWYFI